MLEQITEIFLMLHREVVRYDSTEANYVEKSKYAFLSKKEKSRFPDDAEFSTAFAEKPIYLMNSKNKVYIIERLENFEQINEEWLHHIANLTLTAYNSKYSNSTFTEKKTMQNGFDDSGIRMNTWIAKKEKWTLAELEERSSFLIDRALAIWKLPVTDFQPEEKQLDSYTLEDEAELTGRLIARFTFKNTEQPVTSWVEMFRKVIQILYAEDKTIITKLAMSDEDNIALHFSTMPDAFSKDVEIGDGIYVWTNTSTQSKLSVLNRLFKLYDEDPADLVFFLRDESELTADEPGSRHELRRRYWTYALLLIKEAHGKDGSFSNVSPGRENWIKGFFGISGFNICCVANYDAARVEIVFQKGDKAENKKASKLYMQLSNVSIENEVDWLQMARFHAEWSNFMM